MVPQLHAMSLFIIIFLCLSSVLCALDRKHRSLGGGCLLPERPANGDFDVAGCGEGDFSNKCRKIAGTIVSEYLVLMHWCNPGYKLSNNIKHSTCSDGEWDPKPPTCLKLCKGLSSNTLDLQCLYRGSKVDCGTPKIPGTILEARCKDFYHISNPSAGFSSTKCLPDGTWGNDLFKCVPDCGIRNISHATPTIKGDPLLDQSEFPWRAGLYRTKGKNIVPSCGATIIHPKAVLTAAVCVHNFYDDGKFTKIDEKEIQVAVGKHKHNWDTKETNENIFRVIRIFIGDRFAGFLNKYEHDIAIVELHKSIKFNDVIMPVCFDRGERLSLYKASNAVGTVVSWDTTETGGKMSDALKVARLKPLGFHDCIKQLHKDLSPFVTYDHFCSGLIENVSLGIGDNGNGLTFARFTSNTEQHFIYGIFSLLVNDIVIFTNVTEHMKWIDEVLHKIA